MVTCRWTDASGRELIWAAPWARWCGAAVDALLEARLRFRDDCGLSAVSAPPMALHVWCNEAWRDTGFRSPAGREIHGADLREAMRRTNLAAGVG